MTVVAELCVEIRAFALPQRVTLASTEAPTEELQRLNLQFGDVPPIAVFYSVVPVRRQADRAASCGEPVLETFSIALETSCSKQRSKQPPHSGSMRDRSSET